MSGIYIHIPFCRKACHYCNFHFSTGLGAKQRMLECIKKELLIRKDYLGHDRLDSIYFGGGTPSVLSEAEISSLMGLIARLFEISPEAEITLEANPDDLNKGYLRELYKSGINRLSIGVQSFFDKDLKWMNRSHDSSQAYSSVIDARDSGFKDLSIDLIFANPTSSNEIWLENLKIAAGLDIDHISCYGLTVEPRTALISMIEKGRTPAPLESDYSEQFLSTIDYLGSLGYDHYEMSNYARNSKYAVHNTNYWRGIKYLGIGPSAHSFDGDSRQWNIAHNIIYMNAIENEDVYYEKEDLSLKDRFNEYLMTGLRTKWGCNIDKLKDLSSELYDEFIINAKEQVKRNNILTDDISYTLSDEAKLIANAVISELFIL